MVYLNEDWDEDQDGGQLKVFIKLCSMRNILYFMPKNLWAFMESLFLRFVTKK